VVLFSEKNEFETKITTIQYTTIQALLKYTNYSISVFAFTSKGDGVQSDPIYCKTEEDSNAIVFSLSVYTQSSLCYVCILAPSVPADIKAVISSIKTIVVSWLPPIRPNGRLTGYILYISILSGHKDVILILYTNFLNNCFNNLNVFF